MDVLNIYLPERVADSAVAFLSETLRRVRIKRLETLPVVDAGQIRCFSLALSGTLTHVRAPYAFPFLANHICDEYAGDLHTYPGVDWIMLGGGLHGFCKLVAINIRTNMTRAVDLHPFLEIKGQLGQDAREHDVPVTIARTTANYNQAHWEKAEKDLLALPEERWNEFGANTLDMFPVYEPYIRQYLVKEPSLIVDIGCGLGQTARTLAANFPKARVLGLDLSPQAINVARQAFKLENLEFAVADISRDLGLEAASVDLIVSSNAFSYAENQLAAATHIFSLLHPDGLCLNNCRMGPSHSYWDFPRSLLLPTIFQLQPMDWIHTAADLGFHTSILPTPGALGFDSIYYFAHKLENFKAGMAKIKKSIQQDPPPEYAIYLSHAIFVHSRHVQDNSFIWFSGANHLVEVQKSIFSILENSSEIQNITINGWLYCFICLKLFPESVGFLRACLPEAEPIIDMLFNDPTLHGLVKR